MDTAVKGEGETDGDVETHTPPYANETAGRLSPALGPSQPLGWDGGGGRVGGGSFQMEGARVQLRLIHVAVWQEFLSSDKN